MIYWPNCVACIGREKRGIVISISVQRPVGSPTDLVSSDPVDAAFPQLSVGVALCDYDFVVRFFNPAIAGFIELAAAGASDGVNGMRLLNLLGVDEIGMKAGIASHRSWQGFAGSISLNGNRSNQRLHVTIEPFSDANAASGWLITVRQHSGQAIGDALTDRQLIARSVRLTPREREVMLALHDGASNKAIGLRLAISPRTVEFHRARIMRRFDAKSLVDLVRKVTGVEIPAH